MKSSKSPGHIFSAENRKSSKTKDESMLKHLNHFLLHHYKEDWNLAAEDIAESTLTSDLVGCFCTYLSKEARHNCSDPPTPLLAWSTIQGYFSSFKTHFIDKFQEVPPALADQLTKRYVSKMLQIKTEIVSKNGETLYSKKESASEDDIKILHSNLILE